jgi:hypothetical protein
MNNDDVAKGCNESDKQKCENKGKGESFMKISNGETTYTRNIKCSNTGYHNSTLFAGEDGKERKKDKK